MDTTITDLKAHDVMIAKPVCVEPSTTVQQLVRVFEEHDISGAPVVDQHGALVGIVSKTDLIRRASDAVTGTAPACLFDVESGHEQDDRSEAASSNSEPFNCVEDLMTRDPVTVTMQTPAIQVRNLMLERQVHRIIVVDGQKVPVGIITTMDLLGDNLRQHPDERPDCTEPPEDCDSFPNEWSIPPMTTEGSAS